MVVFRQEKGRVMETTRRNIMRAGIWTAPVVIFGATAPAFATSVKPIACAPVGVKFPGKSWGCDKKHSYVISTINCDRDVKITHTTFAKSEKAKKVYGGIKRNGLWTFDSDSSDSTLWVRFYNGKTLVWGGAVKFSPAPKGKK